MPLKIQNFDSGFVKDLYSDRESVIIPDSSLTVDFENGMIKTKLRDDIIYINPYRKPFDLDFSIALPFPILAKISTFLHEKSIHMLQVQNSLNGLDIPIDVHIPTHQMIEASQDNLPDNSNSPTLDSSTVNILDDGIVEIKESLPMVLILLLKLNWYIPKF